MALRAYWEGAVGVGEGEVEIWVGVLSYSGQLAT